MSQLELSELNGPHRVADADVEAFRSDGYVLLRGVATSAELSPYRIAISSAVERHSSERVRLEDRDTYGKAFLQVMNLWRHDPVVAAYVHASRFAGVAAQLLGVKRVRIYHDQALFKEPQGGITPWHQDAMYWPLDGSKCLTMWMPLIDITPDMGTLIFAAGSHRAGPLSDITISDASEEHFEKLLADRRYPLSTAVPMVAGDATFHSGWTVHRASDNRSESLRSVMTIIWFADGLHVLEPANPAQAADLESWLPGLKPGDLADTEFNRRVG